MTKWLIPLIIAFFTIPLAFADGVTTSSCLNSSYLREDVVDYIGSTQIASYRVTNCTNGCVNGICVSESSSSIPTGVIIGSAVISLGIMFMGLFANFSGLMKAVKILLLFTGLALIINTFAMMLNPAATSINTSIMIMEWFIFFPIFAIYTINYLMDVVRKLQTSVKRPSPRWRENE